jgi:hypothetical protein
MYLYACIYLIKTLQNPVFCVNMAEREVYLGKHSCVFPSTDLALLRDSTRLLGDRDELLQELNLYG